MNKIGDFPLVELSVDGNLGIMTLNDPATLNAMGLKMIEGISLALDEVEYGDLGLRCLLITGAGRGFCSGANLTEGGGGGAGGGNMSRSNRRVDMGSGLEIGYHPVLRRLRNLEMPIVTAVNGAAAGVGMSFALMGDMVLASKSAFFSAGVSSDWSGAGRRLDVDFAAACGCRAGARDVADGRADQVG